MLGLRRARNVLARAHLAWKGRRPYEVAWDGALLRIEPGVIDPVATRVGAWLAGEIPRHVHPGERWVDMGCGTGVVGLALARSGARVTAVDIDPRCVALARHNAARRGVSMEVVCSDHFAGLGEAAYDGVVYNAPFWPGVVGEGPLDRSFYAGPAFELLRRFASEARPRARVVLVALSEAGARHEEAVAALGPARRVARDRRSGEWLTLWRLVPESP